MSNLRCELLEQTTQSARARVTGTLALTVCDQQEQVDAGRLYPSDGLRVARVGAHGASVNCRPEAPPTPP
ncbi:MAG: hypothetical protein ACOCZH_00425 [Phototrophicaceae bacterium]